MECISRHVSHPPGSQQCAWAMRQPNDRPGPLLSKTQTAETLRTLISAVQAAGQGTPSHVEDGVAMTCKHPSTKICHTGEKQANKLLWAATWCCVHATLQDEPSKVVEEAIQPFGNGLGSSPCRIESFLRTTKRTRPAEHDARQVLSVRITPSYHRMLT